MAKLSDDDYREAGANLFEYFRELLTAHGSKAELKLEWQHMQSLLSLLPFPADKTIH
jgi:hypothetical protein